MALQRCVFMSTNPVEHKITSSSQVYSDSWISKIIPALNENWANYLSGLPAEQPSPNLNNWLSVIHTAATTPDDLPHRLDELLEFVRDNGSFVNEWELLTHLLSLTFEAAKTKANELSSPDWQNLLEIQNNTEFYLNRELAQKLLIKTFRVNETATQLKDLRMIIFLNRMELILLEASNLNEEDNDGSIAMIRKVIEDSNLLREVKELRSRMEIAREGFGT